MEDGGKGGMKDLAEGMGEGFDEGGEAEADNVAEAETGAAAQDRE